MDCARTLMIEKNIAIKYWKEAISTAVHTLNRVQLKKEYFWDILAKVKHKDV